MDGEIEVEIFKLDELPDRTLELAQRIAQLPTITFGESGHVRRDVRRFFDTRGFLEVETPILVPSPGLDLHLDAFEAAGGDRGARRWLITSPEYQMKRLLADGWGRIFS